MQRHRDIEILTHIETPVGIISNRKWTGIQALMKKYRMELKPSGIEKVNLSTSRNIDLQEIGTEQNRSDQIRESALQRLNLSEFLLKDAGQQNRDHIRAKKTKVRYS